MTPEELAKLQALYNSKMWQLPEATKYTVRVWDGMDGVWCDVFEAANVDLETALKSWCTHTDNGTKSTSYREIDYYAIFPADIKMAWSGEHTMRGEG